MPEPTPGPMPEPVPRSALSTEHGRLYQGDCLSVMPVAVADESVDCVFADPPFNLRKDYGSRVHDDLAGQEYLAWCSAWLKECVRALAPGGSLFAYNLPRWNVEAGHMLNEYGMTFRHWIALDIKMSLPIPGRLYPSHYSLLYYSKGKPKTFTRPRVPIPVCRHCGGDIKDYGGHRGALHPDGLNLTDVWADVPPVRHMTTKWRGANALSEKLLERVLTIATVEGDLVLDPFGGSGTTYAVAERMHRRWIGVEKGDCDPIIARLRGEPPQVERPNRGSAGNGIGWRSARTRQPSR